MEKQIKDKIFTYRIAGGNYVIITGICGTEGLIEFNPDGDGCFKHRIEIPELIENLPVMGVLCKGIDIALEGDSRYRHDGSSVIDLHLPQYTYFGGFGRVQTKVGYLYPNYNLHYYQRSICYLHCKNGTASFYAKPSEGNTCRIVCITAEDGSTALEIPAAICGYVPTAIAEGSTCLLPDSLTELRLGSAIERIGKDCFTGLPRLGKVYLGEKTVHISEGAFSYYGESYKNSLIKVPTLRVYYQGLPIVEDGAFRRVANVWVEDEGFVGNYIRYKIQGVNYSVDLAPLVKEELNVEGGVLKRCTGFPRHVKLPEGVVSIASYAFAGNACMETAELPQGLKEIGEAAFKGCTALREISIPEGVEKIGRSAFEDCCSLEKVILPKGLKTVAERSFKGSAIREIKLPDGLRSIRCQAFANCKNLKMPRLPKGAVADVYAFDNYMEANK